MERPLKHFSMSVIWGNGRHSGEGCKFAEFPDLTGLLDPVVTEDRDGFSHTV